MSSTEPRNPQKNETNAYQLRCQHKAFIKYFGSWEPYSSEAQHETCNCCSAQPSIDIWTSLNRTCFNLVADSCLEHKQFEAIYKACLRQMKSTAWVRAMALVSTPHELQLVAEHTGMIRYVQDIQGIKPADTSAPMLHLRSGHHTYHRTPRSKFLL